MIRPKGTWASRVVVAALVLAFTAVSASAYTIVMRDGRRVSIPDEFTVTNSTVTYEVGSGIQISIQLASVKFESAAVTGIVDKPSTTNAKTQTVQVRTMLDLIFITLVVLFGLFTFLLLNRGERVTGNLLSIAERRLLGV